MTQFSQKSSSDLIPRGEEALKYIPLDPCYLTAEKACEFPIYLYHPVRKTFVLFKTEGSSIKQEQLEILTRGGSRIVYVPREYGYELNLFLAKNLGEIVENQNLTIDERVNHFHTISSSILQNLFTSPPDNQMFVNTSNYISDNLSKLLLSDPYAVNQLNRLRSYDYYTYSHSMNVCVMSTGLYMQVEPNLTPEEIQEFSRGVLLHDIGKCDIPAELTNKKGPLSDSEWEIMRSHTTRGFTRLTDVSDLTDDARYIALMHHEAIDGSGYPTGSRLELIPLTSRICKVADVFDALTSKRSYKAKMSTFEALRLMTTEMRTKVDQDLLKEFILFLEQMSKSEMRKPQQTVASP